MMTPPIVVIESGENRDKFDLLKAALQNCRFREIVESAFEKSGKSRSNFLIMIKPNLAMFFNDPVTVTDPELVEYLVDRLNDYGFTNVALGEATNIFSKWLYNREIHNIAKEAGYHVADSENPAPFFRCITPNGVNYKFFDLHADAIEYEFPTSYSIYGLKISKRWQSADFRISFAKNKTHEEYVYTLCLKNLLGVTSEHKKHLHYHSRLKVKDVCYELYKHFPIHFNIIDAYSSSHGNTGAQVANKIETKTIIAGENIVLIDWVGALKMGIDPHLSPLNAKALKYEKLPEDYKIIGNLDPYEDWEPVHSMIYDVLLRLDKNAAVRDFLWPATFKNNEKAFPWKKKFPRYVNKIISPFWVWTDKYTIIRWGLALFLYSLVFLTFIVNAFKKNFYKNGLKIKELPINLFNKKACSKDDFYRLSDHIRHLEEITDSLPRKNGTCHTFIDEGILFCMERYVDIGFEDFVKGKAIRGAVNTMKDFIGGRSVLDHALDNENVEYRIERTVYLPQPNLLAFINAKDIDVTKIEKVEYEKNIHKIIWKTVLSDNDSALFDDGAVTFKKDFCGTQVKVMVHQAFHLPNLVMIALRLTGLRKIVTTWLYHLYFKKTIANYCKKAKQKYRKTGVNWIRDKKFMEQVTP
jgi:uncharacterized protein (DUF362 family)